LDENSIKASTQTDSSKKANKEIPAISVVPSGGKKLHKPIIVEFANMITALEVGHCFFKYLDFIVSFLLFFKERQSE
jgi:hypothetical protein